MTLGSQSLKTSDGITFPMNNEIFEDQTGTICEVTSIQLLLVSPGNIKVVCKIYVYTRNFQKQALPS